MPLFKSHGKVEKTGRKRKLAFPMELCGGRRDRGGRERHIK